MILPAQLGETQKMIVKSIAALIAVLAIFALVTYSQADNGNGNDKDCQDAVCEVIQADTNCDGVITATDSLAILLVANGLVSPDDLPCCAE